MLKIVQIENVNKSVEFKKQKKYEYLDHDDQQRRQRGLPSIQLSSLKALLHLPAVVSSEDCDTKMSQHFWSFSVICNKEQKANLKSTSTIISRMILYTFSLFREVVGRVALRRNHIMHNQTKQKAAAQSLLAAACVCVCVVFL